MIQAGGYGWVVILALVLAVVVWFETIGEYEFYPGPDASSSINTSCNATASAFLYGLLAGIHDKRKIHAPSIEDCTDC